MNLSELAERFFRILDERIGPFDRPIQFRPFPFDAGGSLNFLTVGAGDEPRIKYVSWDLFGDERQKRGSLGRYELYAVSDDENWCLDILTRVGRQSFQVVFEPGDTLDIGPWVNVEESIQGILFYEELRIQLPNGSCIENAGLLGCIGITRPELDFARLRGATLLIERLENADVYPATIANRASVPLT